MKRKQTTVVAAQATTLRDLLNEIAEQALQARTLDPRSDDLPDRIDDIDNDLQRVIELVNNIRRA